jgi:predicted nucleic acid-binding protein
MDVFHLVIDTSMLRRLHFQSPDFERLLRQSQMGKLKIYIPQIVMEEERTAKLAEHVKLVEEMKSRFEKLQRGMLGMLVEGLAEPHLELWDAEDVERSSKAAFTLFMTTNKIEVIEISMEHAAKAWGRYFNAAPPFNPREDRETRRKDIPDSWILEAGIEIKPRKGQHCALVGDNKLADAFQAEGFTVYRDVQKLLDDIEQSTAVITIRQPAAGGETVSLDQLRSPDFKDMDIIVLGLIDVLGIPSKDDLLAAISGAGLNANIAEHEAQTMVLSGRLTDTGTHFIPTDRTLAQQAAGTDAVINVLLRIA